MCLRGWCCTTQFYLELLNDVFQIREDAKSAGGSSFEVHIFVEALDVSPVLGLFGCCKKLSLIHLLREPAGSAWDHGVFRVTSMKRNSPV